LDGIELDKTFTDKASGKDTKRPQLELMMAFVRSGDTVFIHSMDRLGRNLDDLRRIVQTLTSNGVRIQFVKEHLLFSGDDAPMSKLMLSGMGAIHEYDRSLIKERQLEGIALAKKRGLPTICQPQFVKFFTPSARPAHDESGSHHSTYDYAAWPSGYAAFGHQYCVKPGRDAALSLATPHRRC
jgi:DNA invertase Pin-like site-specific DNA recombinase